MQRFVRYVSTISGLILACASAAQAEPSSVVSRRPWLRGAPERERPAETREGPSPSEGPSADPSFARNGFFARLSVGSGWFGADSGSSDDERSFSGLPISFEAYIGGTPAPWLGLGGGLTRDEVMALSSQDERLDGDEPDLDGTSFHLQTVSALVCIYPDPVSPLYAYATLGVAVLEVASASELPELPIGGFIEGATSSDPGGFTLSIGAGYDWWVDERWTLGVSGRLLGAWLTSTETWPHEDVDVLMPSVLFSVGYH
jgi:hypothetical protein